MLKGSEELSDQSSVEEVVGWTQGTMDRLVMLVGEEKSKGIITRCACHYSKSDLKEVRRKYEETGDIDLVHRMLQEKFESFLENTLGLSKEHITDVVGRGWGLAGVKDSNSIIATKIPKSGYLFEYLREADPEKRREIYCHCPRVRDALKISETIPPIYCYCGAGFYKGIWEEILQKPVEVEVLETVLSGGEVCKIAIHLPLNNLIDSLP